jgi:myo-inositol 2-dehydrogenase/D-chiro-inositol 1-dehydrogenase
MIHQNSSRRDFLKGSAGIVAGAAAAGAILPAGGVFAAGADETIKIGLVGCGGRGTGACGQALKTKGPVKLVAIGDAFEDNAKGALRTLKNELSERVDVAEDKIFHGFDAYKQVIDSGVDLVILATPPGFRPMHFEYAVDKGKNIFMEKPVAVDAPGVRQVLAAAEKAKQKNLKVGVGLQRHHSARYNDTVKRIQDGAIGDLTLIRVYWNDAGVWVRPRKPGQTEMEYQMRNWYYFCWLSGDHITEQHIHNLDVANWVKGAYPAKAQGQGGRQVRTGKENGEIYDHHFVEFTYPDGTVMLSQCRHQPDTWRSVSEHAHGTKGTADISGFRMTTRDGKDWKSSARGGDDYQVEHDHLFDAIRNNKPYNEAENGAKSTMTSIFGRMATYSGQEIKWDDAINSKIALRPEGYTFDSKPPTTPDAEGWYPIPMPGRTKTV